MKIAAVQAVALLAFATMSAASTSTTPCFSGLPLLPSPRLREADRLQCDRMSPRLRETNQLSMQVQKREGGFDLVSGKDFDLLALRYLQAFLIAIVHI